MNDHDDPSEYRETEIVLRPGEPPVKALVRIVWANPPGMPGEPPTPISG